jgi:hypothetical protein
MATGDSPPPPALIQVLNDLQAKRTNILLSIELLKEPAAPVEEWTLHPLDGSEVDWVARCVTGLSHEVYPEIEGVEGARMKQRDGSMYWSVHKLKAHLESDAHVTMLYR